MWEEGRGGGGEGEAVPAAAVMAAQEGGKDSRQRYPVQLPRGDEDEEGMAQDEEREGSLSGEGEEMTSIKEEVRDEEENKVEQQHCFATSQRIRCSKRVLFVVGSLRLCS